MGHGASSTVMFECCLFTCTHKFLLWTSASYYPNISIHPEPKTKRVAFLIGKVSL